MCRVPKAVLKCKFSFWYLTVDWMISTTFQRLNWFLDWKGSCQHYKSYGNIRSENICSLVLAKESGNKQSYFESPNQIFLTFLIFLRKYLKRPQEEKSSTLELSYELDRISKQLENMCRTTNDIRKVLCKSDRSKELSFWRLSCKQEQTKTIEEICRHDFYFILIISFLKTLDQG